VPRGTPTSTASGLSARYATARGGLTKTSWKTMMHDRPPTKEAPGPSTTGVNSAQPGCGLTTRNRVSHWTTLPDWIEKYIIPEPNSGCWLWTGPVYPANNGYYGKICMWGKQYYSHRLVYEIEKGLILLGLELDHLCRTTLCCNPDHLEAVTHKINMQRGITGKYQSARTHCSRGHPYDEINTYFNGRSRVCRACDLLRTWRRRGKI
jgi:HNH endonuclease